MHDAFFALGASFPSLVERFESLVERAEAAVVRIEAAAQQHRTVHSPPPSPLHSSTHRPSPLHSPARSAPVAPEETGLEVYARRASVLVFDTETTGLTGHVIQMAIVFLNSAGGELATYNRLWKTPLTIHPRAMEVHGITQERLILEGVDPKEELLLLGRIFGAAREAGARMVAHNSRFDVGRLRETALYHGVVPPVEDGDVLCTMTASKMHCNLRNARGLPKAPTCNELHRILMERDFEGPLHDALGDSRMTARCYWEGKGRGWWT